MRHVARRVLEIGGFDRVIVATDDQRVIDALGSLEVEGIMTGPAATGTDRVGEVARREEYLGVRVWINVQGDEPFIPESAVRGALGKVQSGAFSLGTAAAPLEPGDVANQHVAKVWLDGDGKAMGFSRAPSWSATAGYSVFRHVGVYAYTTAALERWCSTAPTTDEKRERLEQLRPFSYNEPIGVAAIHEAAPHGIDTAADLAAANALLTQFSGTSDRVSP